jgi:hypothetical protein
MKETQTKKRVKTEPPSNRWRNRYWFSREIVLPDCQSHPGGPFGPGVLTSRLIWPSYELAEQKALESVKRNSMGAYVVYLGAEPSR